MSKLVLPSLLSYSRSIQPSQGYFYSLDSKGVETPVEITTENLRATFSDYTSANGKKSSEDLAKGNIHKVQSAYMPHDSEALVVRFGVKFLPNANKPANSNKVDVSDALIDFMQLYTSKGGLTKLAKLYAQNLAWGSFLWRNRDMSDDITISIQTSADTFEFKPPQDEAQKSTFFANNPYLDTLTQVIADGLSGKSSKAKLNVTATLPMQAGDEVFPSQEFLEKTTKAVADRVLASVRNGKYEQAIFHSAKIGNAIRTIDTWFENSNGRAIAVEPLGIDRVRDVAIRHMTKTDFYTLVEKSLMTYIEELKSVSNIANISDDNVHFLAACLIRGGVYSGKSSK